MFKFVITVTAFLGFSLTALAEVSQGPKNVPSFKPAFENQTRAPAMAVPSLKVETIAQGLENPWGIAVLPNGNYLVTERPGRLNYIQKNGRPDNVDKMYVCDEDGNLLEEREVSGGLV